MGLHFGNYCIQKAWTFKFGKDLRNLPYNYSKKLNGCKYGASIPPWLDLFSYCG